jgi:phosphoglycerate dehydrogenase-like enzyme
MCRPAARRRITDVVRSNHPCWRPRAAFAMSAGLQHRFLDEALLTELATLVSIDPEAVLETYDSPAASAVEVLLTAWGSPAVDAEALSLMPDLRAVVHAAGSVKHLVGPEVWERGVLVTSAADLNARPVAEFALAAVILTAKNAPVLAARFRDERTAADLTRDTTIAGTYRTTVGVLGASATGTELLRLLRHLDVECLVYDPTLAPEDAVALAAELVDLDELFERSQVLSVHAPLIPGTRGLVDARLLGLLRDGASVINTARGPIIDHDALRRELVSGRLQAVLDVTEPEPLSAEDPLWELPNVWLTPHLAGSMGGELLRLGRRAVDEVRALVQGRPPIAPVGPESLSTRA